MEPNWITTDDYTPVLRAREKGETSTANALRIPAQRARLSQKASSDERKDANDYADGHSCQKTSVVKTLRGSTHKIPMQEVPEGQGREQYCNSAQKVKNSHVVPVNASASAIFTVVRYNLTHPREDAERSTASSTRCTETASSKSG